MKLEPGNYAVIFTSIRTEESTDYHETFERLMELAREIDGFLGIESARDGLGITISYWKDLESIDIWRKNSEHIIAKNRGRKDWYKSYTSIISRIEHCSGFEK